MVEDDERESDERSEAVEAFEEACGTRDLGAIVNAWDDIPDNDDGDMVSAIEDATGDSVASCGDCGELAWLDDMTGVGRYGDHLVCEDCRDASYEACCNCDRWSDKGEVHYPDDYEAWCERCFYDHWSYCEDCDAYYNNDDDHESEHTCSCEAPHLCFHFPANGHGTVEQDEELPVALPAGTIDQEGLTKIRYLLLDSLTAWPERCMVSWVMDQVGDQWTTKAGNYTKRLSREFYNVRDGADQPMRIKLPEGVLSEVGNIARAHSSGDKTWNVAFTRDLNQSASDFYHDGSCWWGGYGYSRCALKSWGGIGMRTFEKGRWGDRVRGRAWVQPLKMGRITNYRGEESTGLVPTHDSIGADAYLVYNGYGDLDGYTGVRIVAHLTSKSYKKIAVRIDRQYVNGDSGYLVADESILANIDRVQIDLEEHEQADAHTMCAGRGVA